MSLLLKPYFGALDKIGASPIYSVGSGGAAYTYLSSYRLGRYADALTQLTNIHSDYSDSEEKAYYVQVINGRNHYITKQKFLALAKRYENPSTPMKFAFIPIVAH